jgi:hypothetical protein
MAYLAAGACDVDQAWTRDEPSAVGWMAATL